MLDRAATGTNSGSPDRAAAPDASQFTPVAPRGDAGFTPIEDYAFLSDCHTGALVGPDGAIDWLCVPRFDSPSIFSALLDRSRGHFRVGPYGVYAPLSRRYEPGTNIVETTWMTRSGWLVVRDALAIGPWRDAAGADVRHTRPPTDHAAEEVLIRTVECIKGSVEVELVCEPMFEYGRDLAEWTMVEPFSVADATAEGAAADERTIRIATDMRLGIEGSRVRARHTLRAGDRHFCALTWSGDLELPKSVDDACESLASTSDFWRTWLAAGDFPDHAWASHLQRSALALKGLTYAPTGALLAALTTSLPETRRGERNWDYRYTWMRDATFALYGLHALGLDWEAEDFMQFVIDLECNEDGSLQIMYGIDGERDLTEKELEHLGGYGHAKPVRIGNGAYDQRQNDVYGAVVDSVYLHDRRRNHMPERLWRLVGAQVKCATAVWREPDRGIWEARGEPKHYVSSKLMCWVALDRGATLAKTYDAPEREAEWRATADEIHADILANGVRHDGVFRQHYEDDSLDASALLLVLNRFLPPEDSRIRNTVLAIERELTEHGLVLRYKVGETDDGLDGKEGTFAICSFWLVSALSEIGEHDRARQLCARLLSLASPLQLYAEEIEADTGAHLGNFPQAFTHLALINAVKHVIDAERRSA